VGQKRGIRDRHFKRLVLQPAALCAINKNNCKNGHVLVKSNV